MIPVIKDIKTPFKIKYENVLIPIPSATFKVNGRCEHISKTKKEFIITTDIYDDPEIGEIGIYREGRIHEINTDKDKTQIVIRFKKFKKLTDDEHRDETLKRLVGITDFRSSKIRKAIEKSLLYNFSVSQLKEISTQKNLKFTQPPKFTRDGFGDSFFLKINKKYYEV